MAASDKELEKQLTEAGKKLLDPPSSVEELLPLLDKVECCLSDVEQSPPDSMQNALSPVMKALVADKLFKHSDIDVNVAVAACISEITRITAPDAPYDDDQMKEVFQLIVSSFENLTDTASRSYSKRTSILDTVAKVRSCVVMLDLECDALIIAMFQHFFKAIRDHHPDHVFSSMETIMNLVLEESEEISPELLSPILDYVRKDDEVPQISRKLAEQVLKSSATKLKPYLTDAVKSLGLSLDGYSNVVVSICEGTSGTLTQTEAVANEKDDIQDNLSKEVVDEDKSKLAKVAQIAENGSSVDADFTKKQDDTDVKDEPEKPDKLGNNEMGNAGDEETDVENKQDQQSKEKGIQSSSVKQEESSKASDVEEETESRAPLDSKDGGKCAPSSPPHDPSANIGTSSDNEKATSTQALPAKPLADDTPNATSPSPSESLPVDGRSKKAVITKKKEASTKEAKSSTDNSAKVIPEEPSSSEAKTAKRSGKKVASSSKTKPSAPMKKSASETKPAKQSGKKAVVDGDNVQVPSKPKGDKKKQGHGKATDEKSQSHNSSDDEEKPNPKSSKDEEQPFEEIPKTDAKRKRNLDKEKALEDKDFGENLVGAKVKVWWPKDRVYYEGVVESYKASNKKHIVLYDDGDTEILNLRREKWEFIEDESEPEEEADEKTDQTGREETSAIPQKKKAKTGNDHQSGKQTKAETSEKKIAASGKSKSTNASATKPGKKPEDEKKENKKPRAGKKSEDERTRDTSEESSKEEEEGGSDGMSVEEEEDDDENENEEKPKTSVGKLTKAVSRTGGPKSGKTKDEDTETGTGTPRALSKSSSKPNPKASSSSVKRGRTKTKTKTGTGKAVNPDTETEGNGKTKSASTASSKAKESGEADTEDNPKVAEASSKGKSGKPPGKKRKR